MFVQWTKLHNTFQYKMESNSQDNLNAFVKKPFSASILVPDQNIVAVFTILKWTPRLLWRCVTTSRTENIVYSVIFISLTGNTSSLALSGSLKDSGSGRVSFHFIHVLSNGFKSCPDSKEKPNIRHHYNKKSEEELEKTWILPQFELELTKEMWLAAQIMVRMAEH